MSPFHPAIQTRSKGANLLLPCRRTLEGCWLPTYSTKFQVIKTQDTSRKCIVTS